MKLSSQKSLQKKMHIINNYFNKFFNRFSITRNIVKFFKNGFWMLKLIKNVIFDTNELYSGPDDNVIDYSDQYVKRYRYRMLIRKWLKMKYPIELIFQLVWAAKPKNLDTWIFYIISQEQFIGIDWYDKFDKTIFYEVFMTFKREYRVLKYLKTFGWEVRKASQFYDKFHQIDLFAINKKNQDCVIQVKTKLYQDLKIDKMLKYAKKNNCIPYLAIISDDKIRLKKLKF